MIEYTDEKIKLMQSKNLLHHLYMMILKGSAKLTPCENSIISDMILRRTDKKSDLIENIDDGIDLDNEED